MMGTILLVEDDPSDEKLTLLALRRSGIPSSVVVVHDGAEALDYLLGLGAYAGRDVSQQPKLVLLDVNLPKLGGMEVLRRIRADPKIGHVPVVILSSSNQPSDVRDGYACGANAYLKKPADFAAFSGIVEAMGRFWLELNESALPPVAPRPEP
jgi:two-component system response regulator